MESPRLLRILEEKKTGRLLGRAAFGFWVIRFSAGYVCDPPAAACHLFWLRPLKMEGKNKDSDSPVTCYKSSKAGAAPLICTLVLWYHTANVAIINLRVTAEFEARAMKSVTSVITYAVNCVRNHLNFSLSASFFFLFSCSSETVRSFSET